jgi:hypothetical protein
VSINEVTETTNLFSVLNIGKSPNAGIGAAGEWLIRAGNLAGLLFLTRRVIQKMKIGLITVRAGKRKPRSPAKAQQPASLGTRISSFAV